ncbi:hypothetical protein AALB39_18030 [Lachnospiraceae bacterium 54-53]
MITREEFYFEPRCIDEHLSIRWYGERYNAPEFERHYEQTVYIRDNGKHLYVYELQTDDLKNEKQVKATFTLICRIRKYGDQSVYGRRIK